ncbi:hypothetical protein RN001_001180 [Aquatica leii]|uniref:Secreted protein n=1 Tax=Aquatica leii TaxID=1421715 RepID=A0AAN7SL27_9COLE|nr:hypothetical protein RN001_001180 [Aquatica leii]
MHYKKLLFLCFANFFYALIDVRDAALLWALHECFVPSGRETAKDSIAKEIRTIISVTLTTLSFTWKDHDSHKEKYKQRLERAGTIKNARHFHYYKPLDDVSLQCKLVSEDEKITFYFVIYNYNKPKLQCSLTLGRPVF